MQVNVGKGLEIEVDFASMPQAALDHIMYIGARNVLMDSHASITATEYPDAAEREEAALAMVQKKLDALMQGIVRVQSTREGDPVRAEALRMATDIVKAALRKAGRKIADVDAKAIRAAAGAYLDANPDVMAKAKARVEEQRAAGSVDLSDLGL